LQDEDEDDEDDDDEAPPRPRGEWTLAQNALQLTAVQGKYVRVVVKCLASRMRCRQTCGCVCAAEIFSPASLVRSANLISEKQSCQDLLVTTLPFHAQIMPLPVAEYNLGDDTSCLCVLWLCVYAGGRGPKAVAGAGGAAGEQPQECKQQ
jgi:hypothetical protein